MANVAMFVVVDGPDLQYEREHARLRRLLAMMPTKCSAVCVLYWPQHPPSQASSDVCSFHGGVHALEWHAAFCFLF